MKKIPSFTKNHDILSVGLHFCNELHGVSTWDLRFKKPNSGDFITPKALHTVEHLLATTLRNSKRGDDIIYFGPMGCRTGFYLLTVNMAREDVISLLKDSINAALALEEIPGSRREECGNYLEHDLDGARHELENYAEVLNSL